MVSERTDFIWLWICVFGFNLCTRCLNVVSDFVMSGLKVMSEDNMLFEDDDFNFYDSEDILNDDDNYENDFDFYNFHNNDHNNDGDFKTTPDPRDDFDAKRTRPGGTGAGGGAPQFLVPPPLPLCHFDKEDTGVAEARTIAAKKIKHIEHHNRRPGAAKDSLHNPMVCR